MPFLAWSVQSQRSASIMPEDVPVVLVDLPPHVRGFVCLGSDYNPCIVINSRLSVEQQKKTWRHEMNHIINGDFDNDDYQEYGA